MVPTFDVKTEKGQRDDVSKNGQRFLLVDCEKIPTVFRDYVFWRNFGFFGRDAY